jgi:hypothetical protein
MVMVSHLDIRDLSLSGIRFQCRERVIPRSRVNMLVRKEELQVKLPGTVVRSSFLSPSAKTADSSAHYEVAVSFSDLSDKEKKHLEKIIRSMETG